MARISCFLHGEVDSEDGLSCPKCYASTDALRSADPVPMTSSACEAVFADRDSADAPKGSEATPISTGRRQEVIEQLCKMMGRVWQTIDPNAHNASDCVCRSNVTNEGGKYRNAGHALTFMEEAVSAHIAKYEREQRSAEATRNTAREAHDFLVKWDLLSHPNACAVERELEAMLDDRPAATRTDGFATTRTRCAALLRTTGWIDSDEGFEAKVEELYSVLEGRPRRERAKETDEKRQHEETKRRVRVWLSECGYAIDAAACIQLEAIVGQCRASDDGGGQ